MASILTHQTTHQQQQTLSTSSGSAGLSQIEQAILRSNAPIDINETEEITVNGQRGIWANKQEVVNWRGPVPVSQYPINEDSNPEIITKRSNHQVEYIQELAIRYLRPPTPPAPGEIIITQEVNSLTPPAPPLIIRQQPPRPTTPEPLVKINIKEKKNLISFFQNWRLNKKKCIVMICRLFERHHRNRRVK